MFLGDDILKICSKFIDEHPCQSVISIKLLCNFIEITLRHGCSPVNLLHILRTLAASDLTAGFFPFPYEVLNAKLEFYSVFHLLNLHP